MCLSTVYRKENEENIFLLKNIANVKIDDNHLVFIDLMGVRTEMTGKIIEIDLMENFILVSAD